METQTVDANDQIGADDHMLSIVQLTDVAVKFQLQDSDQEVELPESHQKVQFAFVCGGPRLFRASRAVHNVIAITEAVGPITNLEPWLKSIEDCVHFAEQRAGELRCAAGTFKTIVQFLKHECVSAISKWMEHTIAKVTEQVTELLETSRHDDVKNALRKVRAEKIDDKTQLEEALASDGVLKMHESMQALRALDKATDVTAARNLQERFSFLSGIDRDVDVFEATILEELAEENEDLKTVGQAMADLTVSQAMVRDLQMGETRRDLVKKISAGLQRRKWHKALTATVQQRVSAAK